ncbi:hypothetical protein K8I31_18420, partial [bacterium]|nr:hypothetical protein [bacterium]
VYDVHDPNHPVLIQMIESFYGSTDPNLISDHWFVTYYQGEYRLFQRKEDGSIEPHSILPEKYPKWMNDEFIMMMKDSVANEYPILLELFQITDEGVMHIKTVDLEIPDFGDPWCFYVIHPFIYWHDMILFMANLGCVDSEPEIDEPDPILSKINQFDDDYALAIIDHPFSENAHVEYRRINEQQNNYIDVLGANEQFLITNTEINKLVIFSENNREYTAVADVPWEYPFFLDNEYLYVERRVDTAGHVNDYYRTEIYRLPEIPASFNGLYNAYH